MKGGAGWNRGDVCVSRIRVVIEYRLSGRTRMVARTLWDNDQFIHAVLPALAVAGWPLPFCPLEWGGPFRAALPCGRTHPCLIPSKYFRCDQGGLAGGRI